MPDIIDSINRLMCSMGNVLYREEMPFPDLFGKRQKMVNDAMKREYSASIAAKDTEIAQLSEKLNEKETLVEQALTMLDVGVCATGQKSEVDRGFCNGLLFAKALLDGKEPQYFKKATPTKEEMVIDALDAMVSATGQHSEKDLAFCNGILYAKSLLENKEPKFLKDITPPPECEIVGPFPVPTRE